jgi:CheY-like chemotaxis protein
MAPTVVLSIGLDAELLSTRNSVLQSAGYSVVPALSLKEAVAHFAAGDFDLVLMCHSFPTKDKERLTSWIRASGSRIPVVSVSGRFNEDHHSDDMTINCEPGRLLVDINEVLINAAPPAVSMPISRRKKGVSVMSPQKSPAEADRKLPQLVIGNEREAMTTEELSAYLANAG